MVEDHREPLSLVRDPEGFDKNINGNTLKATRDLKERTRGVEALSLKLAGLTYAQIAQKMEISESGAEALVNRSLERTESRQVESLREIENARLDRAQAAIWTQVLEGDLRAVDTFLRVSARRAKLNGLDAPTNINLSMSIRTEMEQALAELEQVVMGEVVDVRGGDGEVAGDEGADD